MQRFFITSLARAKRLAKDLQSQFDLHLDRDLPLTQAQRAIALMLGYASFDELRKVTDRSDHAPTPFDELLAEDDLRLRLEEQAKVLVAEYDVNPYSAAWIAARLRLTAHPAGPHYLAGPSSSIGSPSLEYRGHAPGRYEPLTLRDGVFYHAILVSQDIPAMKRIGEEEAASIIRTNTKIFQQLEDTEVASSSALPAPGSEHKEGPSPFLVILDEQGYHVPIDKEIEGLAGKKTDRLEQAPTPNPEPMPRVLRSAEECVYAADLQVKRVKHGFEIVTRLPLPDGRMLASWVEVAGERKYPVPHARGALIEPAAFDDIIEHRYESAPNRDGIRYDRFGDVLRRCGLGACDSDPYALEAWRHLLEGDGTCPKLEVMTHIWGDKLKAAGIIELRSRVDSEALDLLRLSSGNLLDDDHAYKFTRDIPANKACRSLLATYPMIFNEMWSSPEVMGDWIVNAAKMRQLLIEEGLSCERAEYGSFFGLPPLPAWLVDWLKGRRYAVSHDFVFQEEEQLAVYGALNLLSLLGEAYAPETERDWQALLELMSGFGGLFYRSDDWRKILPAETWIRLMSEPTAHWAEFVDMLKAVLPDNKSLHGATRQIWNDSWDECEMDEYLDGLATEDNRNRFVAAFTRLPLRERIVEMAKVELAEQERRLSI